MVTSTGWPTRVRAADNPAKPAPTITTRCTGPCSHGLPLLVGPRGEFAKGRLPGSVTPDRYPGRRAECACRGGRAMATGLMLGLLLGAVFGAVVGLLARSGQLAAARAAEGRLADSAGRAGALRAGVETLRSEQAVERDRLAVAEQDTARLRVELDNERRAGEERKADFEAVRQHLSGEFARLSTEALQQNNAQFLELAEARLNESRRVADGDLAKRQESFEQLLKPLGLQLGRYEESVQRLEVERQRAYTGLTEQMQQLSTSHDQLQRETRNLVTALRSPQTRGRWGELQLRRVVEMAGMIEHCDFDEQVTSEGDSGRLRPDVVIRLPGSKTVVAAPKG